MLDVRHNSRIVSPVPQQLHALPATLGLTYQQEAVFLVQLQSLTALAVVVPLTAPHVPVAAII